MRTTSGSHSRSWPEGTDETPIATKGLSSEVFLSIFLLSYIYRQENMKNVMTINFIFENSLNPIGLSLMNSMDINEERTLLLIFFFKIKRKRLQSIIFKITPCKNPVLFRFAICRINNFYDLALCVLNETTLHKLKGYVFRSLFWTFLFNIVYHNISPIQDMKYQRLSNTILYDPLLRHIWFFRCFYAVSYY